MAWVRWPCVPVLPVVQPVAAAVLGLVLLVKGQSTAWGELRSAMNPMIRYDVMRPAVINNISYHLAYLSYDLSHSIQTLELES